MKKVARSESTVTLGPSEDLIRRIWHEVDPSRVRYLRSKEATEQKRL